MIIVSRQISGTHAARAVLEFAEAHDLARSGRLYSETNADVLTLPESKPVGPNELVFSKLLIFCDALTRWVEAIPLPSEPTGEEIVVWNIDRVCHVSIPICGNILIVYICNLNIIVI